MPERNRIDKKDGQAVRIKLKLECLTSYNGTVTQSVKYLGVASLKILLRLVSFFIN